ncbi:MAG: hypothetical protein HYS45_02385 [Parcubacteria group bacterium]|nr:hypothetical protein [Parcubacteria group bacterium]
MAIALVVPAAVGAVAEGAACNASNTCDSGLVCSNSICVDANASRQADPFGVTDASQINVGQNQDLKGSIANVVNILLGFLGILAVIIILYAGFKWMTASGNEEQVGEARKMLLQAVIGLVIIMLAWVITNFVTSQIGGVLQ